MYAFGHFFSNFPCSADVLKGSVIETVEHELPIDTFTGEYENIDELSDELRKAYEEAKRINEENERLSESYGGSFAFVNIFLQF